MRGGQKKYKCGACGECSFNHWIEKNRASGLRCPACGSRNMELVSKEAKEEAAIAQTVRVLNGTGSTTRVPNVRRAGGSKRRVT